MRESTQSIVLAQALLRVALQEVIKAQNTATTQRLTHLTQLAGDLHRSFVTASQIMEREVGGATQDS